MIENPAWVELAECPCDLTTESCDKDCCCDQVNSYSLYTYCYIPPPITSRAQYQRTNSERFLMPRINTNLYRSTSIIHPSIRPSVRPSVRPSIHPSIHPSILLSYCEVRLFYYYTDMLINGLG